MHPTHSPETDLLVPLPGSAEAWDPHTIHTHYFGFCIPEAQIGAFIYIRYHPYFPLSQGGVCIFRGLDNLYPLDMEHCDYVMTMPWPEIDGPVITTPNGLRVEFLELGRRARVTYASADESVSLDVEANAVTPLAARGHVVPGEELHRDLDPGGMEQMMRMTGELAIRGETFEVDCIYPRDRSWRQLRPEAVGGSGAPPVSWTPFAFGEDLCFNQVGFESPDSDPEWAGLFELPDGAPSHYFAWVWRDGELRPITRVRREVSEHHPLLLAPVKQQIEAQDSDGETYLFKGEAIAITAIPAWSNAATVDSVFRWEAEDGRVGYGPCQSLWYDSYQRAMKERRAARTLVGN